MSFLYNSERSHSGYYVGQTLVQGLLIIEEEVTVSDKSWRVIVVMVCRALSRQSLEQHLNLYSFDAVHFAPQVSNAYQSFDKTSWQTIARDLDPSESWNTLSAFKDLPNVVSQLLNIISKSILQRLKYLRLFSMTPCISCRCIKNSMTSCSTLSARLSWSFRQTICRQVLQKKVKLEL